MANKTLIPALKAKVGDWNYYICVMKYAQVAKEFSFAYELGGNQELNELLQRGLSERTKDITEYLKKSEHRFLGALIVAAWGGEPSYIPVQMDESDDLVQGLDSGFGVLTFNGSQQYFALDGQHRLKAIKDSIKQKPELGNDEISVILVSHYDTNEGKERTRRLFTNINKNAKSTSSSENIALDEDDGFAILNRRLINDNHFFSENERVVVYNKNNENGTFSIASSIKDSNRNAVTSIKQLYDIVKSLSFDTEIESHNTKIRPTEEQLESSYSIIEKRVMELFESCGDIVHLASKEDLRPYRKNKSGAQLEHPFLKGVIQKSIAKVISEIAKSKEKSWDDIKNSLEDMTWKLNEAPWNCVISESDGKRKMQTNRDFVSLLEKAIKIHINPKSKNEIKQFRKEYKSLKGIDYPISDTKLFEQLP